MFSQFEGFYLAKSHKENVYIKRGVDVNLAHFVPTLMPVPNLKMHKQCSKVWNISKEVIWY